MLKLLHIYYIMDCKNGVCEFKPGKKKSTKKVPRPRSQEWTVYGADWCPFCKKAKQYLENEKVDVEYVDVEDYGDGSNVKDQLYDLIGDHKTIPIVFHYEKLIGGYSELINYFPTFKMSKVGGFSNTKPSDKETQDIVDTVKDQFEKRVEKCYDTFELVEYKTQVVAGINYLLNVKLGDDEHAHLRVFRDLSRNHTLKGHIHPKKPDEDLEVFAEN